MIHALTPISGMYIWWADLTPHLEEIARMPDALNGSKVIKRLGWRLWKTGRAHAWRVISRWVNDAGIKANGNQPPRSEVAFVFCESCDTRLSMPGCVCPSCGEVDRG